MKKKFQKPLTNKSGEVREITSKDIQAMRSAKEILPENLLNTLAKRKPGQRGPQRKPTKILVTLRYSPNVIDYFRATGEGWQVRVDEALKEWIKQHPRRTRYRS